MRLEHQYKKLLHECMTKGYIKDSRAGEVKSIFGPQIECDLTEEFPILTSKRVFYDKAYTEFLWMFTGDTGVEFLRRSGIKWWDPYADDKGDLGKVYGYQVRNFAGKVDQVEYVMQEIFDNSRRAIISFWNPADLEEQSLPPCYTMMTFVKNGSRLNMKMDIRSSDLAVGLPYDMIIGALFLISIASVCGLVAHRIKYSLADAHIYLNNELAVEQYIANPMHDPVQLDRVAMQPINYVSELYIPMKMNV